MNPDQFGWGAKKVSCLVNHMVHFEMFNLSELIWLVWRKEICLCAVPLIQFSSAVMATIRSQLDEIWPAKNNSSKIWQSTIFHFLPFVLQTNFRERIFQETLFSQKKNWTWESMIFEEGCHDYFSFSGEQRWKFRRMEQQSKQNFCIVIFVRLIVSQESERGSLGV